jgi:tetratricopeptide (TPR) repeat protein
VKILKLLLSLSLSCSLSALSPEESSSIFSEANKFYKDGSFEKALELYEKIPNKSAYVNYNIGNCYFKIKKYGYALLHWRRAEDSWGIFNREELLDNITMLNEKVFGTQNAQKNPIIKALSKIRYFGLSVIKSIPVIILQLILLILWIFLFIYIRFLYRKKKKFIIITLFALIALFGILLVVRYSIHCQNKGIVINTQALLRSGPGNTFQVITPLSEAEEVVIRLESDDYYKVKRLDQIGWVQKSNIEKI